MPAFGPKLTSVDGAFLYLETPETPMHLGGMATFKPPDNSRGDLFEDIKASRLAPAARDKQKLEGTPT